MIDISKIGPYTKKTEPINDSKSFTSKTRTIFYPGKGSKAFLIENPHTIELRTDQKLAKLLCEKYESVMESRYFGKNGIEIVLGHQLTQDEIQDLIRLSYDLTKNL